MGRERGITCNKGSQPELSRGCCNYVVCTLTIRLSWCPSSFLLADETVAVIINSKKISPVHLSRNCQVHRCDSDKLIISLEYVSSVFKGSKEARIFWEVWEDSQSGDQQQHVIRWFTGEALGSRQQVIVHSRNRRGLCHTETSF